LSTSLFDIDAGWTLHPQVAVRPERFGALLYHFGTRRLSFVKTPGLLRVLVALADADTARAACARAGVDDAHLPGYQRALETLASSSMICLRETA
jgi:putative mycofactocin binding protein MftB